MVDAVVFDLDGLLLESEQVWSAAKRELTAECGGRWTGEAERAMLGMSSPEWTAYMRAELGVELEPEAISADVVARVERAYAAQLPLLPGADEAVHALADVWPLGLASSSNREVIDLVLRRAGWASRFTVTVSSEEVARGKPAPDVYLEAVRRLGVAPQSAVAFEDSSAGLRSAAAAGLAVIAVPNEGYPPDDAALGAAAIVLDSLRDLTPETVRAAVRERR
jgi:HAD superfamily hydrolase (TIGR01509 family)